MSHPTNPKYVVIAGGLTGGPITPLLGVVDFWHSKDDRITPVIIDVVPSFGHTMAQKLGFRFYKLTTGKLRRYKSWQNILVPFLVLFGFIQSIFILQKIKPKIVLGAGGFVQLPVMYAAWLLRIPRAIHQQDVLVTLSNRLCAPVANLVTTTFEFSIRDFPQESGLGKKYIKGTKVFWTGNPTNIRELDMPATKKYLEQTLNIKLNNQLPVMLVFGGAGGAEGLNNIITSSLPELTKVVQIIHITGPNNKYPHLKAENYFPLDISKNMPALYNVANLVLARAGINTLTELAEFGKPSIIVPMPNSHQELNAELIYKTHSGLVLDQSNLNADILIKAIRKIMFDQELQKKYQTNLRKLFPAHASENIVALIEKNLKHHDKQD